MFFYCYDTVIGKITLAEKDESISGLYFGEAAIAGYTLMETELIKRAYVQLCEYFEGKRKSFDLPLKPVGTEFRMKVWKLLCDIPYGEAITYGELARRSGNPNASRAVGGANHNNPISIFIPCHRVIGANGKLVGYGGGLDIKEFLLELEK